MKTDPSAIEAAESAWVASKDAVSLVRQQLAAATSESGSDSAKLELLTDCLADLVTISEGLHEVCLGLRDPRRQSPAG